MSSHGFHSYSKRFNYSTNRDSRTVLWYEIVNFAGEQVFTGRLTWPGPKQMTDEVEFRVITLTAAWLTWLVPCYQNRISKIQCFP